MRLATILLLDMVLLTVVASAAPAAIPMLDQIWSLVADLIQAHGNWLPQYN